MKMNNKGITNKQAIYVLILVCVFLGATLYGIIPNYLNPAQTQGTFVCPYGDGQTFTSQAALNAHVASAHAGTTPPPSAVTHGAAAIQYSVCDWIQGSAVTTAPGPGVDILQATNGVFDLLGFGENKTATSYPTQSGSMYPDGSQILIHAYARCAPTGGLAHYDRWYYVVLHDGNPIYYLGLSNFVQSAGSPHYTYTISTSGAATTGQFVSFTSGTTNYWDIGKVYVIPRTTAAGLNLYLTYSGTTLNSVVDGATFPNTWGSTSNATLAGKSEHIDLLLTVDAANLAWGADVIGVTSQGQAVDYQSVIVMTTNMTSIDVQQFIAEGWTPLNDNTLTAEKGFYKVVGSIYTTKGSLWTKDNLVPIYSAAATGSVGWKFRFWVIDMQLTSNVAIGAVTTTIPTAYGMISAYGPSAMIQATAYSTSSGAGTAQAIGCTLTTSA